MGERRVIIVAGNVDRAELSRELLSGDAVVVVGAARPTMPELDELDLLKLQQASLDDVVVDVEWYSWPPVTYKSPTFTRSTSGRPPRWRSHGAKNNYQECRQSQLSVVKC